MHISTKYEKLLNKINEYDIDKINFDETIAKEIIALKDNEISSHYTDKKWKELIDMSVKENSMELLLALIKCPVMPANYFFNIRNHMDRNTEFLLLMGKQVPKEIIHEIAETEEFVDNTALYGDIYSQDVLSVLALEMPMEKLEEIDYIPFHLTTDKKVIDKILEILENKDNTYFKSDVSEFFTSAIIENKNIPEEIRNKAFDVAYNPDFIKNPTDYMAKKLYEMYADSIFELDANDKFESFAIKKSSDKISDLVSSGFLSQSCQIDFIKRYASNPYMGRSIVLDIILNTDDDSIIEFAIKNANPSDINKVLSCNKNINNNSFNELLKIESIENLTGQFVASVFNHRLSDSLVMKFLNLNNKYINMAVVLSDNVSDIIKKSAMILPDSETQKELCFLYHLKKEFSSESKTGDIISLYATEDIIKKEESDFKNNTSPKEYYSLIDKIINTRIEKWPYISDSDYNKYKENINNVSHFAPFLKNTVQKLLNKLERVYNESILIDKYPLIFTMFSNTDRKYSKTDAFLHSTVCDDIDINNLCNMSDKDLITFAKDVKKYGNEELISALISNIESRNTYFNKDGVSVIIYKLADLYNELTEYMQEIQTEISENEKEIERE